MGGEPFDACTAVRRSARACGSGGGRERVLPPSGGALPGERVERQPLGGSRPAEGAGGLEPSGGDHASHRFEAHADLILSLYEARRRFSCGNCVTLWPSMAWRPARAACGGSSVATASPVKWGGPRGRAGAAGREGGARGVGPRRSPTIAPERLVFVDETAANTKMARPLGRAPRREWPCRTGTTRRPPSPPRCTPPAPRLLPLFDGATNGVRFPRLRCRTRWPRCSGAATPSS